ncbi:MAG: stage II sporulation protein M [Flavobacteriales bacterium]|nr:stage II sporulation protein M [Flavobacteriales bacterium]
MMTIWLHGVFEISAVIIAGAAGITLGNSILFPGSMSRSQSMLMGAKRGMKMMIGLTPFMIGAGFIEAFISRFGPDMNWGVNLLIIGVSLLIIVFYFVVYPFIVARKHNFDPKLEENPIYIQEKTIEWYRLRTFQDIFNDTFVFYRKGLALFGKVFIFIILLSSVTVYFAFAQSEFYDFKMEWYEKISMAFSFSQDFNPSVFVAHILLFSCNFVAVYHSLWVYKNKYHESEDFRYWVSFFKFFGKNILRALPVAGLMMAAISFLPWYFLILTVFLVPLLFNLALPGVMENKKFFPGIARGMNIAGKNWMSGVGIFCVFLLPALLAAFCPTLIVEIFKTQVLGWFIETQTQSPEFVYNVVDGSYYAMVLHFILPLFTLAFGFLYFGTVEKEEAFGMFKRLETFGEKSRVYETADEGDY